MDICSTYSRPINPYRCRSPTARKKKDEETLTGYYSALDAMERWAEYYNYKRPHSALRHLVPADYYRGDLDSRIAEPKEKLVQAVEIRQAYWQRESARDQGQTLT